jgi:hypothetical protein
MAAGALFILVRIMFQIHPDVDTPPDDTVIWRYIDLEKLIALLHSRSLYLCRLDHLRDPWEGRWPPAMAEVFTRGRSEGELEKGKDFVEWLNEMRKLFYVSCWHENSDESAAFWDQYKRSRGVAIRSTVGRLKRSNSSEMPFFLGRVQYRHYGREEFPAGYANALRPVFLKRRSFEHEREVRVLIWHAQTKSESDFKSIRESYSIGVDLAVLIDSIYVAPECPAWLVDPLRELLRRFDLPDVPVRHSNLYDKNIS